MSVIKVDNLTSVEGWTNGGLMTGATLGGFLAAHAVQGFVIKTDNGLAYGAMALAGLAGSVVFDNVPLQALFAGVAIYGVLKGLKMLLSELPGADSSAVSGLIPDSAKVILNKFIPSLSGDDDELAGMSGDDDDLGDLEDMMTGLGNAQENNLTAGYSGMNNMAPTQNSFGSVSSKLV